ncbi:hypothetical protein Dsin_015451 [Dipteronia sinensis]|uniref:Zinc knuckle CX2CX4HX4C domain-containing protein n=1 Tax=Dipteronia sinensis TaxID=43782 RepID=A0AAE0ACL0_9ROSI|nr:hypothetical protein Dsin_015451 [Dipteronia sinensis]
MIGEVREIDLEAAKEAGGRFIRVRVIIDVNVPLMRSIRVDLLGNGKITTMLLRYERLLDYCFKCVRLGHSLLDCSADCDNREVTSETNMLLNVWLRTLIPPKRYPYRNERNDRLWGKSSGEDPIIEVLANGGEEKDRRRKRPWDSEFGEKIIKEGDLCRKREGNEQKLVSLVGKKKKKQEAAKKSKSNDQLGAKTSSVGTDEGLDLCVVSTTNEALMEVDNRGNEELKAHSGEFINGEKRVTEISVSLGS